MKQFIKIFSVLILLFGFVEANSQVISRKAKDSTENSTTKYITWASTPTGTSGIFLTAVEVSGTTSGYALLQVRSDTIPTTATTVWEDLVWPGGTKRDTVFFTDVTTYQPKSFPLPSPLFFNGVRLKIVTSGTQKIYLYAGTIKR